MFLILFQILIISDDTQIPYMRPPLSKELWYGDDGEAARKFEFKQWNGKWRDIYFEKEDFYCKPSELADKSHGVALALNKKVWYCKITHEKFVLHNLIYLQLLKNS